MSLKIADDDYHRQQQHKEKKNLFYDCHDLLLDMQIGKWLTLSSSFTDCPKVLTLYGMSNLVSEDEHSLDLMDPYQRDAKQIGKMSKTFVVSSCKKKCAIVVQYGSP